jgi:hypothetical protein
MTMAIQCAQQRSFRFAALALLMAVLFVIGGATMVFRLSTREPRAGTIHRSPERIQPAFVSREQRRTAEIALSVSGPATAPAAVLAGTPLGGSETEHAGSDDPFLETRRERRDPMWARQTESSVREAMGALREKKVALQSVQCASIRCTLDGTIGPGGNLQDVVSALSKVGLTRGRFKRVRGADGTTTISAVLARQGYKLDGSPKDDAVKAL